MHLSEGNINGGNHLLKKSGYSDLYLTFMDYLEVEFWSCIAVKNAL